MESYIPLIRTLILACFLIPLIISLVLSPVSIKIAKRFGIIDIPSDKRRMHDVPKPCFGGMSIFVAASITILLIYFFMGDFLPFAIVSKEPIGKLVGILVGGLIIFIVGLVDDIKDMKPLVKLFFQFVAASITFALGVRIPTIGILGLHFTADTAGLIFSFFITVIWIVGITNTINLIDGLDGLANGVSVISSIAISYAAYIHGQYTVSLAMIALAGAALGLLPFNFYPAKTFMGDSGAMFLGFMLASISLVGPAKSATIVTLMIPVLVLGVPIFDILFAIVRRTRKGISIFKADRGHIHHQLASIGLGQRRSVLMIYGISAVMGIAAVLFSRDLFLEALFLFFAAILFMIVLIWGWKEEKK